ncbi:MAG: nucleoside hydrolase [Acidobacteriota bacterium]|nr:nucleoside hydrolase [Acidobacteriota bacterium]
MLASAQTPIIFDTDMGNDVDDALALAILHSLTSRGECRLIGVTLTNANASALPYIRMIDQFYGRADIPVGVALRHIKDGDHDGYMGVALRSAPAAFRQPGGDGRSESAVALLRRLLAGSPEKVTIVQVGFSTNLAALLDSPPDSASPLTGMELVKSKVALLSAMAGNFAERQPEYNVKLDVPAARSVFERWPTAIILSGFEIGRALPYPAASIERDFAYTEWHPVAVSYRAYNHMPYDRPTWDLTAALVAVRGNDGYFGLSVKGRVFIEANGTTRFEPGGADRQYLILDSGQRAKALEALTLLASEPPRK